MSTLNILLVDDDRNLATTLSHGLYKAMGGAVLTSVCYSGPEALAILGNQPFDVIISDFSMPGMSGQELLVQVRQDHPKIIPVLTTAYGTETLEVEAHRHGIAYIAKPFELPSLVQLIQSLVLNRGSDAGAEARPYDARSIKGGHF